MRTADDVLLTCCPPAPLARKTSISMSSSRISMLIVVVDDRIDEHRREARVAARLRVVGRDAHEAVHARLRAQEPVRVLAADLEHRALDAGLLALGEVQDLDLEPFALGPARVHAHEHLRPVLRLGATRTRADLQLRVALVVRALQQRLQLERAQLVLGDLDLARRPRPPCRDPARAPAARPSRAHPARARPVPRTARSSPAASSPAARCPARAPGCPRSPLHSSALRAPPADPACWSTSKIPPQLSDPIGLPVELTYAVRVHRDVLQGA